MNKKATEEEKLEKVITNMVNEGSDNVTTLSEEPEAKYESLAEKEPGEDKN